MQPDTLLILALAGACFGAAWWELPRRLRVAIRFWRCGYKWRTSWYLAEGR